MPKSKWLQRAVVALLVVGALIATAPASATAAPQTTAPTGEFCDSFAEHYEAGLVIALASAFASIGTDDGDSDASQARVKEVRDLLLFVLSPKLAKLTKTLADEAPSDVREVFARQVRPFEQGVRLLRRAGVSRKQIEALANLSLDSSSDEGDIVDRTKVSEAKLRRAAKQWANKYSKTVVVGESTSEAQSSYRDVGGECGVFPDGSVQCSDVVDESDVTAIIGAIEKREETGGSCQYESAPDASGDANEVKVNVFATTRAFEDLTKESKNQSVPNLGDEAVAREGLTGFSDLDFSTCGRTFVVRDGTRTVIVGGCVRDGDVDVPELTTLTQHVLERLDA